MMAPAAIPCTECVMDLTRFSSDSTERALAPPPIGSAVVGRVVRRVKPDFTGFHRAYMVLPNRFEWRGGCK